MPAELLIFIPTYNEVENVSRIYHEIRRLDIVADILFLDDSSPDGTGKVIDRIALQDPNVKTIHRAGKQGIGSAHQEGIKWAYEKGYKTLVTMDCDFTHSPTYIYNFLDAANGNNIVVGSRYLQKHSLSSWNLFRKFLTHFGHFLTVNLLGMPYDASGAFRLYPLNSIDRRLFGLVRSPGYSFFFESLFILNYNKIPISEIPIELPARTYGTSKMSWKDAWKSFSFLFGLMRRKSINRESLTIK